jgi:alpha-L-glutamate ligase-like protein/uncharacterized protein (TIGR02421 family)
MKFFKNYGILGINARNLHYIRPYNKKKAVRLADDKLKTKQFLSARDIAVPKLYAAIRKQEELEKFDFESLPGSFVLKPNFGYGGEGIVVISGRKNGMYEKSSGELMSQAEMSEHIGDILEGRFSLSGVSDSAFFEQLITCDETLAKYAYKGLPDIRIVVHNLIPVMAMLRLPTRESDGKANLHLGAIGVGIDIAKGTATHVLHHNKIIDEVPEVGEIRGLQIPYWDEMLLLASRVQFVTNLGYLAVDVVLDKNVGPVLLEINARAGLAVQIANLAPLRKRLQRIEGVDVKTPEKGVRIAQDMFGNKLDKEVKKVSGKEVIGSREKVKLLINGETRVLWASINPLLEGTLIDRDLVEELGLKEHADSGMVKLKFSLADLRIQTLGQPEDLAGKDFDLVLGRRDLGHFLIDPSKGKKETKKLPKLKKEKDSKRANYLDLDRKLLGIDRQIKLLYHLKPVNLAEEKEAFMKDKSYNPQFQYPEFKFDPFHLKEKLEKLRPLCDESPLGRLFLGKLEEIKRKIEVLEAIGTDNFESKSIMLYDKPGEALLAAAKAKLDEKPREFSDEGECFDLDKAALEFERVFKSYGLEEWKIKVKEEMVSDCVAGKKNVLFLRKGSEFSEDRLRMLVAHEIETHILTAENGKSQGYEMFNRGFANYLETQEGLAVWNQEQVLKYDAEKNYRSAVLVFVVDFAREHSFAETFDYCVKLGMDDDKAFQTTLKVKRGLEDTGKPGAFTKDMVYFSGYLQVKEFVAEGGDLKDLYYGKYNLRDLDKVKEVPHLREPRVLPGFLS